MTTKESTVKKQVLLYLILPIFVVFIGLRLFDYIVGREQAIELAKNGVHEQSNALANRVDTLVINASTVATATAVALSVNENWSESDLFQILHRNVAENPLIYGAAIAFEPGVFQGRRLFSPYAYRSGTQVKTIDIGKESYDYTQPQWEWYGLPKKLQKSIWTEPYFDEGAGNIEMVTFSVPFYRNGKLAGITTIDLDLSRLPELAKIHGKANSNFYILSKGRHFVYHREAIWLGKPIASNSMDFGKESMTSLTPALEGRISGVQEARAPGRRTFWLSAAPIKAADWQFIEQVDAKAEMQGIEKSLQHMILRTGIALILAMAGLMAFISFILEPITRLAKAAQEVAEGRPFSFSIPNIRNEVGGLAKNIAVMTERLQERERSLTELNEELEKAKQGLEQANLELESRVLERTAELQNAMASLQEGEARFRQMLLTSPIAVLIADAKNQKVLFSNPRYCELVNSNPGDVAGVEPMHFYARQADYDDILARLHKGNNLFDRLIELNIPGVGTKWALASYLLIQYEGEEAVLGWFYDITRRKVMEESLQLAALVYENSSEAMTVTDAQNRIIAINPAFTEMTGYSEAEVLGQNPKILSSTRHGPEFFQEMWDALQITGRWKGEIWNRRKDGEEYIEWLSINTIYTESGNVHRRVALFSDITEKKRTENLIWNQANFDHLTDLPNRRLFHDRLEQEILKGHRDHFHTALLFVDLDRFKEVNDTLGHDVGDQLLIEASRRLKHCVRDYDTLARLGGDEFTVILSELQHDADAARVATTIIESLSMPFRLNGQDIFVSASIGIAIYPDDAQTAKNLIRHADQAMYEAKKGGRSRFHFFTRELQDKAETRMRLAADLRNGLQLNQFLVYYQPIVCLITGKILKAEALLRWNHPEHGFISPAVFIPVAEDTGIINEIGDWVFTQALAQVKRCQSLLGNDFQISVNKSPLQFSGDNRNTADWVEKLAQMGLNGSSIVVEITEGLLMNTDTGVIQELLRFRDAGIQVAIDDFGTGYSALSYLNKFDIDYLKIDQSFTRHLAPDNEYMALCEAIVVMAHKLGLKVIAEGVETELQRDLLKQMGCDYAQGYLYAKPLPPADFEQLLS